MALNKFHRAKFQILTAIIVNIVSFAMGTNIGWLAPAQPLLMSADSPFGGPIAVDMIGWVGSFVSFGAFTGTLFFGTLAIFIGYKKPILLGGIPITVAWLLIIFGRTAWHLCWSRFLCGMTAGAAYSCITPFISEIASDFIRGELNSFIQINMYFGILCGFIGGSYLPFDVNPWVMLVVPFVFLVGFVFMPDSPQNLIRSNRFEEAEKSLRFYRNCRRRTGDDDDAAAGDDEIEVRAEFEKFKLIAKQAEQSEPLRISEFFTSTALRAMMISPFLMAVSQFSGSFAISNYAVIIFKETGTIADPNVALIVMGCVQVFGTYSASQLMDKVGRRMLLLISTGGGCLALLVTGTFSMLARHGYDLSAWSALPVISVSFYVFICAIGILPVPYLMVSEVLPQRIRRVGGTVCTCTVFVFQFTMLKAFPPLMAALELYGCFFAFACVSVIGLIFTLIFVQETKGKNLDVLEVAEESSKDKPKM